MRIILIATQMNYVLEAPLGARPPARATPKVMNVWQSKADDYSIVQCAMLYGLELGLQRRFERHRTYEMFQELNQVIVIPRHFEYMLTDRTILLHLAVVELIGAFISLNPGICLKY